MMDVIQGQIRREALHCTNKNDIALQCYIRINCNSEIDRLHTVKIRHPLTDESVFLSA